MWLREEINLLSCWFGFTVPCLKIVGKIYPSYLLALNTASRSKFLNLVWPPLTICCEHPVFYWYPRRKFISGTFFFFSFVTIKMLSVLHILQNSPPFTKEVLRILNAISLLHPLWAAQGHNYKRPEGADAVWFLFFLPALSNQFQWPQCRQNQRQLQHCLSTNCKKQKLRDIAEVSWTEGLWSECWGTKMQPPQTRPDPLGHHVPGSRST